MTKAKLTPKKVGQKEFPKTMLVEFLGGESRILNANQMPTTTDDGWVIFTVVGEICGNEKLAFPVRNIKSISYS